ncbi:hypothetical protein [uncultured Mucilaginibacter sp.]|uniref:hypothetical protein n=1 Tax=uncultured Mucilaginibacter sp. TaxID=797541 RepID=UPI00260E35DA|nr:hypothetical protein [uncultured Mucilaginibacter sp.]
MKKIQLSILLLLTVCIFCSSCATVFGGHVNTYQRTRPKDGEPQRRVRVGALIADVILFWPGTIVDFATGAIYKPAPNEPSKQENFKTL